MSIGFECIEFINQPHSKEHNHDVFIFEMVSYCPSRDSSNLVPKISWRIVDRFRDILNCYCKLRFDVTTGFRLKIESRRASSFWRRVLKT